MTSAWLLLFAQSAHQLVSHIYFFFHDSLIAFILISFVPFGLISSFLGSDFGGKLNTVGAYPRGKGCVFIKTKRMLPPHSLGCTGGFWGPGKSAPSLHAELGCKRVPALPSPPRAPCPQVGSREVRLRWFYLCSKLSPFQPHCDSMSSWHLLTPDHLQYPGGKYNDSLLLVNEASKH